jgi:hypothetical protein
MHVVNDADLTRKSRVITQVSLCRKDRELSFADRTRIAGKNLYAARRASGVAAAAVKNVNAAVLDREHEFAAFFGLDRNFAFSGFGNNYGHLKGVS